MTDAYFGQFGHHSTLLKLIFTFLGENEQLGTAKSKGTCLGFSLALQQAVLAGKEQEQVFYERLTMLLDYASKEGNYFETLKKDIKAIYTSQKIAANLSAEELTVARDIRPVLTEEQRKLLDINAFIETTFLLQSFSETKISEKHVTQAHYHEFLPLLAPAMFDETGKYLHSTNLGIFAGNQDDLGTFFASIQGKILEQPENSGPSHERISFLLGSGTHAVSVYFDLESKKWRFVDINNLKPNPDNTNFYSEVDNNGLAEQIFKAYPSEEKGDNVFSITRLSTQGYDLTLNNELGYNKDRLEMPQSGKLYVSEEGGYIYKAPDKNVYKGSLDKLTWDNIRQSANLKDLLYDFTFKKNLLDEIAKQPPNQPFIKKLDEIDDQVHTASHKLLFAQSELGFGYEKTDSNGYNALMLAAREGQVTMAKNIINVNKKKTFLDQKDNKKKTAVNIAAHAGNVTLFSALINTSSDEDKASLLKEALEIAVYAGNATLIADLINISPDEGKVSLLNYAAEITTHLEKQPAPLPETAPPLPETAPPLPEQLPAETAPPLPETEPPLPEQLPAETAPPLPTAPPPPILGERRQSLLFMHRVESAGKSNNTENTEKTKPGPTGPTGPGK